MEAPRDAVEAMLRAVQEADAAIAALTAARAGMIDALRETTGSEMELRAMRAEVACATRTPERSIDREWSEAFALCHRLPATLAALRQGRILPRHARILVHEVIAVPAELHGEWETRMLCEGHRSTGDFARTVRRLTARLVSEGAAERHRVARRDQNVTLVAEPDGMACVSALLPAPEAVAVFARLDDVARDRLRDEPGLAVGEARVTALVDAVLERRDAPVVGADGDGLANTDGDGCADADGGAVAAAVWPVGANQGVAPRRSPRLGRVRTTVLVKVPVETLLGRSHAPAELEGYGPVDPETARELTAEAPELYRLLVDPHRGVELSLGRRGYRPTAGLRRALRARDMGCTFPGCGRRAGAAHLDHRTDWVHGGATDAANLDTLCVAHHRLKHGSDWSAARDATGELVWTSPLGRRYRRASAGDPEPP